MRDDWAGKQRLMLGMLGKFIPNAIRETASRNVGRIGNVGPYTSFEAAQSAIKAQANERATAHLAQAAEQRMRAQDMLKKEQYADAITAAAQAQDALARAYCAAQSSKPGEFRGFWINDAWGAPGKDWDETIRVLAANGFNAVFPRMASGGVAYYPSEVLPVSDEVRTKGDPVAACVAACKQYGVKCHAWKICWKLDNDAPASFLERMKREGRLAVRYDGSVQSQWLCPTNPANQQIEIGVMLELARKYELDGVHFDYIRYENADTCFCAGCRKRFEERIGKKVAHWPGDVRTDPALAPKWLEFRRAAITKVVAAASEGARKARPGIQVSAALFTNWPVDRDTLGQDWKAWCEQGYLDFACPMDYTPYTPQFATQVRKQKAWVGKAALYPGIGISVWPEPGDAVRLVEQVRAARDAGVGGFVVFALGPAEFREVLPSCGEGITRLH